MLVHNKNHSQNNISEEFTYKLFLGVRVSTYTSSKILWVRSRNEIWLAVGAAQIHNAIWRNPKTLLIVKKKSFE